MIRGKMPGDDTQAVITAQEHIRSAHGGAEVSLPETCVLFEMGMALPFLQENFDTMTVSEHLPCFIADSKCLMLRGVPGVCFVSGGYGAPAAVDTLETVRALGVKRVLVAGMCGGFGEGINVGDVIVPEKILCEEGTSFHYCTEPVFARPDAAMHGAVCAHFANWRAIWTQPSVSCDAFYRQTFAKEEAWREMGCVAVDMEASALLSAAAFYGMPAAAVLLCSDRHPMRPGEKKWGWGSEDFSRQKREFVCLATELAQTL